MKTTLQKTTKLRKGVAVGSAMILGASLGDSAGQRIALQSTGIIADHDASSERAIGAEDATAATRPLTVRLPSEATWTKADSRRFRELATKRATGVASAGNEEEFAALQRRRRFHYLSSADEVIAEWQRRRFISEMLDVLNRNVRFFKTEDKTRLRSLRQTKRA